MQSAPQYDFKKSKYERNGALQLFYDLDNPGLS